jgi:hypothetical protein
VKNIIVILNILFLFSGNILFSNIHHHDHDHCYESEIYECEECINIENNNNYIIDFQSTFFLNTTTSLISLEYFNSINSHINSQYLSRAPPIS